MTQGWLYTGFVVDGHIFVLVKYFLIDNLNSYNIWNVYRSNHTDWWNILLALSFPFPHWITWTTCGYTFIQSANFQFHSISSTSAEGATMNFITWQFILELDTKLKLTFHRHCFLMLIPLFKFQPSFSTWHIRPNKINICFLWPDRPCK